MTRPHRAALTGLALLVGACAGSGAGPVSPSTPAGASPDAGSVELLIFGAASLADVLADVEAAYEADHPGTTLTIATDSSAALATQIELGAPADVFLSADVTNPARLADAGLAAAEPVVFAANGLAIVTPIDDPGGVSTPRDLARPGLRIVAAGDAVPITTYARQLVADLARQPTYPADFAAAYEANVVSREDNVRAVLAKLELGEGDAGIVYASDAAASSRVRVIEPPIGAAVAAAYSGVAIEGSTHPGAARSLLDWLAGPEGQAILARHGFLPPAS